MVIAAEMKEKIAIIGAGNVATHLAKALNERFEVACVASRTQDSASALASSIGKNCLATTDLSALPDDCALYIIAVNDDAVADVVAATPDYPGIWTHTSGSVGKEVFKGKKTRYGVFYPLQTFSKNADVDISKVPILIEGNLPEVVRNLDRIGLSISEKVMVADSAVRERIHIAAVFACNFANLMWMEADDLLRSSAIGDISLFAPLLEQTLGKLGQLSPRDAMTGPARRGDLKVIEKHLSRLYPDQQQIYKLLSDRILNSFSSDK